MEIKGKGAVVCWGNTNSQFFHNSVNRKRRRNQILGLQNLSGELVVDAQ